jgi:hypothetical protein
MCAWPRRNLCAQRRATLNAVPGRNQSAVKQPRPSRPKGKLHAPVASAPRLERRSIVRPKHRVPRKHRAQERPVPHPYLRYRPTPWLKGFSSLAKRVAEHPSSPRKPAPTGENSVACPQDRVLDGCRNPLEDVPIQMRQYGCTPDLINAYEDARDAGAMRVLFCAA